MSQDTFPSEPSKGIVAEVVQDGVISGQEIGLSITKNLELRIQTDRDLRESVEALVAELQELKMVLQMLFGGGQ